MRKNKEERIKQLQLDRKEALESLGDMVIEHQRSEETQRNLVSSIERELHTLRGTMN